MISRLAALALERCKHGLQSQPSSGWLLELMVGMIDWLIVYLVSDVKLNMETQLPIINVLKLRIPDIYEIRQEIFDFF